MKLRGELSKFSRGIRDFMLPETLSLDEPMNHKSDSIIFDNKLRKRKRIVMLTTGCDVGTCTMCPFPNESLANVKSINLCNQFDNSFPNDSISNFELITIFCNGNFFSDRDINIDARLHIYRAFNNSSASILCVESLPQFITDETIATFKKECPDKQLACFVGFQSSNDFVREVAINTTCTKNNFEKVVKLFNDNNYLIIPFVMIKPTFMLEDEAINDTLATLHYLSELGIKQATLCPTRVAPNTVLELLYNDGMYQPPWIWSVIEILKHWSDYNGLIPMVNTTELKPDKNLDSVCAYGCPSCHDEVITTLEKFLYNRDFKLLENLSCGCELDYLEFKIDEFQKLGKYTIEQRINIFLEKHKK